MVEAYERRDFERQEFIGDFMEHCRRIDTDDLDRRLIPLILVHLAQYLIKEAMTEELLLRPHSEETSGSARTLASSYVTQVEKFARSDQEKMAMLARTARKMMEHCFDQVHAALRSQELSYPQTLFLAERMEEVPLEGPINSKHG